MLRRPVPSSPGAGEFPESGRGKERPVVRVVKAAGVRRGVIEVTLAADGQQVMVAWEERGMPLEYLAGYGAGIQVHVEDLAAHLAGRERCDAEARFGDLFPAYQDLAASTELR